MASLLDDELSEVGEVCEEHLTGKAFQKLVAERNAKLLKDRIASIDSPGVHATTIERFKDGSVRARLIPSLPDFQGVFGNPQTEIVFDAKVCSQPHFKLDKYRVTKTPIPGTARFEIKRGSRSRQLRFMYKRASFGSVCFFLIHWNKRVLKTKSEGAETYAFPIWIEHPFWLAFEAEEIHTMSRKACEEHGIRIPWTKSKLERTLRPDIEFALMNVANLVARSRGGSRTINREVG